MPSAAAVTCCKRLIAVLILIGAVYIFFIAYKGQENADSINHVVVSISWITIKNLRVEVPYRLVMTNWTAQVLFSNEGFRRNVNISSLRSYFDYENVSISCGGANNEMIGIGGKQEISIQIKDNPEACNNTDLFSFLHEQPGKEFATDVQQNKINMNFTLNFAAFYELDSQGYWRAKTRSVCKDLIFEFDRDKREWIFKGDGTKACHIFMPDDQKELDSW